MQPSATITLLSLIVTVLLAVGVTNMTAANVTTDINVQNVSLSVNEINVTGVLGYSQVVSTIYNDSSTWFDARDKCHQDGSRLEDAPPSWLRWQATAQAMRDNEIPENFTFWNGIYRPFEKSDSWYRIKAASCDDITDKVGLVGMAADERCLSCRFPDLYGFPVCAADVCTHSYPYVCFKYVSNATIDMYNNFTMESIPANVTSEVRTNATSEIDCAVDCESAGTGIAFTFNFTSGSCILYRLTQFSSYVNYTIIRSSDNVTHGIKQGLRANYSTNTLESSLTWDNYTLPECLPDTVPRNYCLCEQNMTAEELERVVEEIIKNLTIDPSQTSKNKQKYSSLTDDRPYSNVTGSLAVCIIVVVLAIPIVSDVLLAKHWWEKKKLKKTRKGPSS